MRPIVIGAGPAGLAAGAALRRAGLNPLLLERGEHPGQAWHNHYERLHLHTSGRTSGLPFRGFPSSADFYPSRQQVVDYLTDYAAHFELDIRTGVEVSRARREDADWVVHAGDQQWRTDLLVVCTGLNRRPFTPEVPGADGFAGTQVHSARYRSGREFQGQRVLVVGSGNSGAEIALDLLEHGAVPTLVVRSPIHVTPRDLPMVRRSAAETSILLSKLPTWLADLLSGLTARLVVGDLSRWGIERPKEGIYTMIRDRGRVALLDVGTIDAIKSGHIGVVPGLERMDGSTAVFADQTSQPFDALVWATGYRPALEWVDGLDAVLGSRGAPRAGGGEPVLPGLHFVGYRNPPYGAFRGIHEDAVHLGEYARSR